MSATAQQAIFSYGPTVESARFDWGKIQEMANEPLPAPPSDADGGNNMLSRGYHEMENRWQNIMLCRQLLLSRHAGWIAAAPDKADPVPPVVMMRDDDMKVPFVPSKP